MKSVKCKECANRVVVYPIGFETCPEMHCAKFCIEVTEEDGCTFGYKGQAITGSYAPDVVISDQSATNGDRFC